MDIISIKVHPPWYARGTPIINPRDGPPMAENNKLLFAIGRGPSARGNPAEVRSLESAIGSQNHDSDRMEDQSRGNPVGKTRLWLTLKTTFFNTKNSVYGQWYALLGDFDADRSIDAVRSGEAAVDFDLSAYEASQWIGTSSDNVKMEYNVKMKRKIYNNNIQRYGI